ncbi:glycosyltransferase family 4 protein [Methylomonas methanica]|uniref:Glycosyl transferase group 1 n=1 Tax=Methylomonas methanica (strain DSM 25384 / MC09) TaxID=857087 RepID=G0A1G2_METMM|nr:glycosyltransferase family 4 protein [Methylomonas methanica]AEF98855.1 glycosyl transferase group 1 [Methylomonas methanica MC09]
MNMQSQPQKLIFINRYFCPDHSATSQMLSDLAFGLAKDSAERAIHIVTSRQRYDDASAQLPAYEVIQNVHIHRVATTRFGRQNLLGRAIDYVSFYAASFFCLLKQAEKGDTLIAKTDPPLISVIVALVAKLKRAHLVNWLQDLFPEVAAELGVKLARGLPYKILKSLRNTTLHQAKMNVAIGELMADRLRWEGIPDSKITVIHNWADGEQLKPVPHEQNPLRTDWGLQGKFVVGYSGNLGRSHDFSTILDAAAALKDREDIVFLLIGGGAQLPQVQQDCLDKGLSNVLFKPYQPREKLSESLSVADVHLISLKPELESLIVPSKFYGVLAVGRPVIFIGAEEGELAGIIYKHHCGYVVAQNDVDSLSGVINQQVTNVLNNNYYEAIRALFDEYYAKANATRQFEKVLCKS